MGASLAREEEASALPAPITSGTGAEPVQESLISALRGAGHARVADLLHDIHEAFAEFHSDLSASENEQIDALIALFTAFNTLDMRLGDVFDRAGIPPGRKEREKRLRRRMEGVSKREISENELRAIVTSIAFENGFRLEESLSSDSPKNAAMRFAARALRISSRSPEETIGRSIERFRQGMRGKSLYHFDNDKLTITAHKADEVLLGMKIGKPGRPKMTR